MAVRRAHVAQLKPGLLTLPEPVAHHLVRVLRLADGAAVELFDTDGRTATATLRIDPVTAAVTAEVRDVTEAAAVRAVPTVRIASAVPKGDRADYLVEKLAELAVAEWCPLVTARSVVKPDGPSKPARWQRIAQEAARQSGSPRVLRIAPLTPLADAIAAYAPLGAVYGCTRPTSVPVTHLFRQPPSGPSPVCAFIGPEGGWTDDELARFVAAGVRPLSLGPTVLRVESAAVLAAAALSWVNLTPNDHDGPGAPPDDTLR
ncbi:MAG: RsmE family RNA methyltransferase [Tepidisphaerales bacterium]